MTNADIVSRVRNGLNSISKDDRISRRYILHVAKQKATFLISQKLNDRSLFREDNLYKSIDCFEMEPVDVVRCEILEFRRCKSIMRSKCKLPKLIYSRYGNSLKEVITADGEREFKVITPSQYRRDKNRVEKSDYIYYYIKDGYLYLLDTEIELVSLYLISMDLDSIEDNCGCNNSDNDCKSLWDYDFNIPDKLEEAIVGETIKEVYMSKQIPRDENPNTNNNEK
jgi:hypothetical protein